MIRSRQRRGQADAHRTGVFAQSLAEVATQFDGGIRTHCKAGVLVERPTFMASIRSVSAPIPRVDQFDTCALVVPHIAGRQHVTAPEGDGCNRAIAKAESDYPLLACPQTHAQTPAHCPDRMEGSGPQTGRPFLSSLPATPCDVSQPAILRPRL